MTTRRRAQAVSKASSPTECSRWAFSDNSSKTPSARGSYKRLEVRFQGMVKLGEIITCRGVVTEVTQEKNRSYATCEIEAVDSSGRVVTKGTAQAWLD